TITLAVSVVVVEGGRDKGRTSQDAAAMQLRLVARELRVEHGDVAVDDPQPAACAHKRVVGDDLGTANLATAALDLDPASVPRPVIANRRVLYGKVAGVDAQRSTSPRLARPQRHVGDAEVVDLSGIDRAARG